MPRNLDTHSCGGEPMRNRKGFTLIELLISMAIVAILMAIIIPQCSAKKPEETKTEESQDEKVEKVEPTKAEATPAPPAEPTCYRDVHYTFEGTTHTISSTDITNNESDVSSMIVTLKNGNTIIIPYGSALIELIKVSCPEANK
jgi:prepilin-type N-terminal cleavage/methylation domain-containing protein